MMEPDGLSISLNAPTTHIFHPGDTISGQVTFRASSDVGLGEGITITLEGSAHVQWMDERHRTNLHHDTVGQGHGQLTNGMHTTNHNLPGHDRMDFIMEQRHKENLTIVGHEKIFEEKLFISANAATHTHIYPFSMKIPFNSCLSWSTVAPFGKVEYAVTADVKKRWYNSDKKARVFFMLTSKINPRTLSSGGGDPYFSNITTVNSERRRVGCCCFPFCCWYFCSKERVGLTLKVHSLWAFPGKTVQYTLEVDTRSTERQLGNARIQLVGTWTHIGMQQNFRRVKKCETKFHEEHIDINLGTGEQFTINDGTIKLPPALTPTQMECAVLKLTYKLRVLLDQMSGCANVPATVEVDILIGSEEDDLYPENKLSSFATSDKN